MSVWQEDDYIPAVAEQTEPRSSWQTIDLTEIVAGLQDGTLTAPEPLVGGLAGGSALFYAGRVNGVHGDSNAGKTWTALAACAQEIQAGKSVVYIDMEDNAAGIVARLLSIGVKPQDITDALRYLHPDERFDLIAQALVRDMVLVSDPTLVVIDSTGEGLALEGANPNADEEVARWFRLLPRMIANLGPAVITLDHTTKADGDALWPIGSQRKRAAITGAQYLQKVVKPFSRGTAGFAVLTCAKDRNGHYRSGQKVAELHMTPHGDTATLELRAVIDEVATGQFRPTILMERVSRFVEQEPESSVRQILEGVGGKAEAARTAISVLVSEGYLTTQPGPRNATLHTSSRAFREAEQDAGHGQPSSEAGNDRDRVRVLRAGHGDTVSSPFPGHGGDTVGHGGVNCSICGHPLHPIVAASGDTTHPSCEAS